MTANYLPDSKSGDKSLKTAPEEVSATFDSAHNIIVHPGGGGFKGFKPTHCLFLNCSDIPDPSSLFDGEKLKNIVFPYSYKDNLSGGASDLMDLQGERIVMSETDKSECLDRDKIKHLVGSDSITCRKISFE